jgi:hypothetical protein
MNARAGPCPFCQPQRGRHLALTPRNGLVSAPHLDTSAPSGTPPDRGTPKTGRRPRSPAPGLDLQHGPITLLCHGQLQFFAGGPLAPPGQLALGQTADGWRPRFDRDVMVDSLAEGTTRGSGPSGTRCTHRRWWCSPSNSAHQSRSATRRRRRWRRGSPRPTSAACAAVRLRSSRVG